jgi:hypothetical protein
MIACHKNRYSSSSRRYREKIMYRQREPESAQVLDTGRSSLRVLQGLQMGEARPTLDILPTSSSSSSTLRSRFLLPSTTTRKNHKSRSSGKKSSNLDRHPLPAEPLLHPDQSLPAQRRPRTASGLAAYPEPPSLPVLADDPIHLGQHRTLVGTRLGPDRIEPQERESRRSQRNPDQQDVYPGSAF